MRTSQISYIGFHKEQNCLVNLAGDYDYLIHGYYSSQDLELEGKCIYPTCKEALDAYITPVLLEKAGLAGIEVPNYYLSNGFFEPPVIVDAVNPFMSKSRVVRSQAGQKRIAKSLTRNFKYSICCLELEQDSRVGWFRCVLGRTRVAAYRELAAKVWDVFHLPLAYVRIVSHNEGECLLSGIWPLPYTKLNKQEKKQIDREIEWLT